MSSEDHDKYLFKIIVIGDASVGKSCLLYNYIHATFKEDYTVTLGVEFASKILELDNNTKIKLQIWDTAGQESFRSIIKSFYKKAAAVLLVYNIAKRDTFERIENWINEIKENADEDIIITLIGNKNDKNEERSVTFEEGKNFQEKNGIALFFETSAKTGNNIDEVFLETTKKILKIPKFYENQKKNSKDNQKLNQEEKINNKKACC